MLAYCQYERRLWLELHRPEKRRDDGDSLAAFAAGHERGALARHLYDLESCGVLLDAQVERFDAALARSQELLATA